jgi:hypothetical protein
VRRGHLQTSAIADTCANRNVFPVHSLNWCLSMLRLRNGEQNRNSTSACADNLVPGASAHVAQVFDSIIKVISGMKFAPTINHKGADNKNHSVLVNH